MAKLSKSILGLSVSGSISGALTYLKRMRHQIVEKKPELKDPQTQLQLDWRHMFNKAVALWHALSAAEKAEWESAARPKHMTGYAWYISQALRPNPGIYLPLQGGTMQGIIQMDGYPIQTLKDPVGAQDGDTKAARDAAIAAAIGGSLTCDIYGYDGAAWQKLLVESAALHNLRVKLYDGPNGVDAVLLTTGGETISGEYGLRTRSLITMWRSATSNYPVKSAIALADADIGVNTLPVGLWVYNGATWDRLRSYGTGILKVGRAEIGLSTLRRVGVGQVKAAAGKLYWMTMNPTAANSVVELSDDLDGSTAIKWDMTHGVNSSHHMNLDPPMEFSTGIYLKTLTNMTSIIFGYL